MAHDSLQNEILAGFVQVNDRQEALMRTKWLEFRAELQAAQVDYRAKKADLKAIRNRRCEAAYSTWRAGQP